MKLLVTGASGFVGRAILRHIVEDVEVHTASRSGIPTRGALDHRIDLLDADSTTTLVRSVRPTHVIHAAWFAAPGRFWDAARENLDWVRATLHLGLELAEVGAERLVGVGTCVEPAAGERSPWIYGTAKAATRELLAVGLPSLGTEVAWGRLFQPYGHDEHSARLIPSATATLAEGRRFVVRSPKDVRDFIAIDDVATALLAMLRAPAGTYDIGTARATTVLEVVELIGDRLGARAAIDVEPERAGSVATRLVADADRWVPGWAPTVALERGIDDAVQAHGADR